MIQAVGSAGPDQRVDRKVKCKHDMVRGPTHIFILYNAAEFENFGFVGFVFARGYMVINLIRY